MNINESMKLNYETTIGNMGGSEYTVIPKTVSQILEVKKGDKLEWIINITDKGPSVNIKAIKEAD
jgi:bifunctional DNA-binding transcriptional regulator/antitoxin component of YhaV-PrlF toxin-antitoxin module